MMKTLRCIFMFGLVVSIQAVEITIVCNADTTCSEGYALTFTSGTRTQSACSSQCTDGTSMTVQVYSCTTDVYGFACDSKICWYADSFRKCIYKDAKCDSQVYDYSMECKNCITNTTCPNKCVFVDGEEMCPDGDATQCAFSQIDVTVSNCTDDSWGFACQCCGTSVTTDFNNKTGVCFSHEDWYDQIIIKDLWDGREVSRVLLLGAIAIFLSLSRL